MSHSPSLFHEVNQIICEYLSLCGLDKTLNVLKDECEYLDLPYPEINSSTCTWFSKEEADNLLKAFDYGDAENFFKLWTLFQSHICCTKADDMAKLEIYMMAHFAKKKDNQKEAMIELKLFLHGKERRYSFDENVDPAVSKLLSAIAGNDNEDDHLHDALEELGIGTDTCNSKLRSQLSSTLEKYFDLVKENICQQSRLVELIAKKNQQKRTRNLICDGKGEKVHELVLSSHQKIRKDLQKTRDNYGKLLLVTQELVSVLEKQEMKMEVGDVMSKCQLIFPEIFTNGNDPNSLKNTDSFNLDHLSSEVSLFFTPPISPASLDYGKIKTDLTIGSVTDKLCLLQTLRWLLTKSPESCREIALDNYVAHDLLGLRDKEENDRQRRIELFNSFRDSKPTYLKECMIRLLNAISSMKSGRTYLSSSTYVIIALTQSLSTFVSEDSELDTLSFISQMIIATMQKMSLKKPMRLFMIENKVIDWLVNFMKRKDLNNYQLEYAWALLMNLCLHDESWGSCVQNGVTIFNLAVDMLLKNEQELAPYVVSTLYSVLRSPEMYNLGKSIRFEALVSPTLAQDTELSSHLHNLIGLLYKENCDRIDSPRETDYDDEDDNDGQDDVFESEIELPETWISALGEGDLTGDELLLRKYLKLNHTKQGKGKSTNKSQGEMDITKPVTPSGEKAKKNGHSSSSLKKKRSKPDDAKTLRSAVVTAMKIKEKEMTPHPPKTPNPLTKTKKDFTSTDSPYLVKTKTASKLFSSVN